MTRVQGIEDDPVPNWAASVLLYHHTRRTRVPLIRPESRGLALSHHRRGVREAEGARLESVYGVTPIEGSNPSLSAKSLVFARVSGGGYQLEYHAAIWK